MASKHVRALWMVVAVLAAWIFATPCSAQDPLLSDPPPVHESTVDQKIDEAFGIATGWFVGAIFSTIDVGGYQVLWVVIWLALAGLILTLAFGFINLRAFGLAIRTVRGKYSRPDDPGEITHFQALSTAVSGTVGLGNIAGVAIGISMAGPGVAFWLFLSGFLGMATKFAECTLGMKYREIDPDGTIHGGGMHYLRKGFAERGMRPVGVVLAILFAIFCVFASFGGGNIFQINQATAQLLNVTGGENSFFYDKQWLFGLIVAIVTALVIIGGIRGIAKVTSKLVPLMCLVYIVSALLVLIINASHIPEAIREIVTEAFKPRAAVTGGLLAAFIWGMRRATFSNEAGIGSAPIAHSAAKSRMPASEGVVALLEPFIDTVVVCTMTSLVLVTTMNFDGGSGTFVVNERTFELGNPTNASTSFGIGLTSAAFETVASGFKYVLFLHAHQLELLWPPGVAVPLRQRPRGGAHLQAPLLRDHRGRRGGIDGQRGGFFRRLALRNEHSEPDRGLPSASGHPQGTAAFPAVREADRCRRFDRRGLRGGQSR
jgi:alanine or glycine:cation symporter, AGCS family